MPTFQKKESLIQNIAYMALMAAINVVFVLLTTFVPILFLLIVFVLPLTSTIVCLHCKKRYFPIYAISTIGLCMICTIWKIDDTIFYVIPSVISGFIFGLMIEKEISGQWIVLATTGIQMLFSYLAIPLITWFFNRDIVLTFATIFKLDNFIYLDYLTPVVIFIFSLIQQTLSYIIINEDIKRFGFQQKPANLSSLTTICGQFVSILLVVIFALTYKPLTYVFVLISLYFSCLLTAGLLQRKKIWLYISILVSVLITFFIFPAMYNLIPEPLGLTLICIYSVLIGIIVFIDNCLLNKNNNIK